MTTKTQNVRIGFEAALDAVDSNWRTNLTPGQVDAYRTFYQAALRDFSYFLGPLQTAMMSLDGSFSFMVKNSNDTNHSTPVFVPETPEAVAGAQVAMPATGPASVTELPQAAPVKRAKAKSKK